MGGRRRLPHRRVAETLEALRSGHLDPHLLVLGIHDREGEVWDKAVAYLRRAGLKAADRSAHREAVASYEDALRALGRLPDAPDTPRQAVELRLDLRNSLWPLGEVARILAYLREAEGLARTLDDPRPLGWVSAYLTTYL